MPLAAVSGLWPSALCQLLLDVTQELGHARRARCFVSGRLVHPLLAGLKHLHKARVWHAFVKDMVASSPAALSQYAHICMQLPCWSLSRVSFIESLVIWHDLAAGNASLKLA